MIRRSVAFSGIVVLLSALSLLAQVPPQFSADMKISSKGMGGTGKLYVGGQKVRMDMSVQGAQTTVITRNDRKVVYMLMPNKTYMEMSTEMKGAQKGGPEWRMYDPANPCADTPGMSCTKAGTGIVSGRLCNKWLFTEKQSGSRMTVWIDQKTAIPVKSEMSDGSSMELLNIKEGSPSPSLFEVPAGYQKFDMNNMMRNLQQQNEE